MKIDITLIFPKSSFLIQEGVFPPLGILYLSAYLKNRGISVQCLDLGIGHTKEMAESDIIGISMVTAQRDNAYDLISYYKEKGKTVVVGGAHATHSPEDCYSNGADYVIQGYGEEKIYRFLLGKENFNNFIEPHFKSVPIPDRDALPITSYKYHIDNVATTTMMSSRGCPANCSFCAKLNNKVELRTSDQIIEEIDLLHNKYGFEGFMFFDDVFVLNKKRLSEVANYYEKSKFKFRCFARTDLLSDDVCRMMEQMGVVEVGLGIESGSDYILDVNTKGTNRQMNYEAVCLLHKYGIRAKAFLIVGLPGESLTTIRETSDWIEKAKPDDIDISIFKPLPGSDIYKNPDKYKITFSKEESGWYKGIPGKYETTVETEYLSSKEIIACRDLLEDKYKKW